MQNGIDQFVCKEGSFEVLNMISGETVLVGPNQKAGVIVSGSLMQSMAAPGDYPNEIQFNENLRKIFKMKQMIYQMTKLRIMPDKLLKVKLIQKTKI